MAPRNEIGGAIHSSASQRPADTLPNTAGLEHFAASVLHGGSNAPDVDCITAADPVSNLLHGGSYD